MSTHQSARDDSDSAAARQRVLMDLKRLLADTESLIAATAGDVGEAAIELRGRLTEAAHRFQATYEEIAADAAERVEEVIGETDQAIRRRPYYALAAALGIGVLLGALAKKRS